MKIMFIYLTKAIGYVFSFLIDYLSNHPFLYSQLKILVFGPSKTEPITTALLSVGAFPRSASFLHDFFSWTDAGLLMALFTVFLYGVIVYMLRSDVLPVFGFRNVDQNRSYLWHSLMSKKDANAAWLLPNQRLLVAYLLLSLAAILICFLTSHLVVFYVAFEFVLVPFFGLVALFGSRPERSGASMRLVFYTVLFSLPLAGFIFYNFIFRVYSFNFLHLAGTLDQCHWLFALGFYVSAFLAFAVKVPLVPLHTWLPEAHGEAPTFGSMLLAGILLKLGTFGFLMVCSPLLLLSFNSTLGSTIFVLVYVVSVFTIFYSSFSVFIQTDIKKKIAYYSIGHMGFVMLGLSLGSTEAIYGAIITMVAHGLSSAGLFFCVGYLYEAAHTRSIDRFRGVATVAPVYATFFFFLICANISLPGTLNFVGEWIILGNLVNFGMAWALLPLFGVLLNGISSVIFMIQILFGETTSDVVENVKDVYSTSRWVLFLLVAPIILLGPIGAYYFIAFL